MAGGRVGALGGEEKKHAGHDQSAATGHREGRPGVYSGGKEKGKRNGGAGGDDYLVSGRSSLLFWPTDY